MTYPTVIVNGVSVRVDSEGRYNLNDLHAAAVLKGEANDSQRPSLFMRSAQIKRFAQALTEAQKCASVQIIKGGLQQGVWGLELVAIRYAAWLSPQFEIRVYETFREAVLSGISPELASYKAARLTEAAAETGQTLQLFKHLSVLLPIMHTAERNG